MIPSLSFVKNKHIRGKREIRERMKHYDEICRSINQYSQGINWPMLDQSHYEMMAIVRKYEIEHYIEKKGIINTIKTLFY